MSDPAWKKHERAAAREIGAERSVGSGSLGRADRSRSDSTDGRIYLECKHSRRRTHAQSLMDDTHGKAKAEGKVPLVCLKESGRHGRLWVVRSQDVAEIVAIWVARMDESARNALLGRAAAIRDEDHAAPTR